MEKPARKRKVRHYTSCSGCFESEDGHPVGEYPVHPKHGCYVGSGCHECQGRGFVRDHMAESFEGMTDEELKEVAAQWDKLAEEHNGRR